MDKEYVNKMRAEITEFRKKMKMEGKQFFRDCAREIFDAHPELQSFHWRQYTPYFNDGDPCVFRAGDVCVVMVGEDTAEIEDDENSYFSGNERTLAAKAWRAVRDMMKEFDDDDLLDLFDDHVRVEVTREGIEVEEYSHD